MDATNTTKKGNTMHFETREFVRDEKTRYSVSAWFRNVKKDLTIKPTYNYYFHTLDQRSQWIEEQAQRWAETEEIENKRKEARKQARANLVNPYKLGDIVYDSWGYDQTNIDWYQVAKVTKRSITLRPIAAQLDVQGINHGSSLPRPNEFVENEKPVRKILQVLMQNDGTPQVYIKSEHGWISKWDGEKSVGCSWDR